MCAKEILGVRNATFEENARENEGIWVISMCALSFIALQNMVAWGSGLYYTSIRVNFNSLCPTNVEESCKS